MMTLGQLAAELDVTRETIDTFAGQIADDPDLYDGDTEAVTAAGAQLICDQVASGSGVDNALQALAHDFHEARERIEDGKLGRVAAVRQARKIGATWQQIADAFALPSREHARSIAAENR